jgi:hypothetical protein
LHNFIPSPAEQIKMLIDEVRFETAKEIKIIKSRSKLNANLLHFSGRLTARGVIMTLISSKSSRSKDCQLLAVELVAIYPQSTPS